MEATIRPSNGHAFRADGTRTGATFAEAAALRPLRFEVLRHSFGSIAIRTAEDRGDG
jgi:hypothetical protein